MVKIDDDRQGLGVSTPRVTIILTFYNNESYVRRALELIDAQTLTGYELIIVDDGSTDATPDLIRELTAERGDVSLILKTVNEGVAAARNSAVAVARGEYVWFVDCDDSWQPDILAELIASADQHQSDVVVCRAVRSRFVDDPEAVLLDGLAENTAVSRLEAIRMLISGTIRGYLWNKLIRTRLLLANPFPHLSSQSDLAGVIGILDQSEIVSFVGRTLYTHLVRPGSITRSKNPNLGNLERCWQASRNLAIESGAYNENDEALVYFDYWLYYAAIINTYHRAGSDDPLARAQVADARRRMTFRGLRIVAKHDKRLAIVSALMKVTGPAYSTVYSGYRAVARRA